MDINRKNDPALSCGLTDRDQVANRHGMIRGLHDGALERLDIPNGIAVRFPGGASWCGKLTEFIVFERACCPFLSFNLDFEPHHGPVWMRVQGPPGSKELVQKEVALSFEEKEQGRK